MHRDSGVSRNYEASQPFPGLRAVACRRAHAERTPQGHPLMLSCTDSAGAKVANGIPGGAVGPGIPAAGARIHRAARALVAAGHAQPHDARQPG